MSVFRIFVDGQLFFHPQLSQLAITEAKLTEDAENIDSLTLSAPFNHPYLTYIRPMASTIVCKKGDTTVFEGRALNDGSDFYNTHTWTCESALAYLKDSQQPPFSYKGTLKGTDGTTPHIGANGNWYVGDTDTGVKSAGTDYVLTSADKSEIAALVLAEIPDGDTVSYGE